MLRARRRLRDANLAQARRDGAVQPRPVGHHGRTLRTEHRGGHRFAGREFGQHVPVHDEVPRPSDDPGGVRRNRDPLAERRQRSETQGCGRSGDGRRIVRLLGQGERSPGRVGHDLPDRRYERHADRRRHQRPARRMPRRTAERHRDHRPDERDGLPLRLDERGAEDPDRSHHPRRTGGVCLPAGHPLDAGPHDLHLRRPDRNVRLPRTGRLLDQPPDAVRPRAGDRYGRR